MTNGESSSDGGMHSNGMYPLSTIIRIMTAINRLECVTPGEIISEEFIKPMDLTQTQVSRDARIPASRLTEIIKKLYELSVKFNCVIVPIWISTHDNVGADALSRCDLGRFHEWAKDHMCNHPHQHSHSSAAASLGASI